MLDTDSVAISKQGFTESRSCLLNVLQHISELNIFNVHNSCTNSFRPIYSFFAAFNFPFEISLNEHSFELFICGHSAPVHHTLLYTVVYGTHSG